MRPSGTHQSCDLMSQVSPNPQSPPWAWVSGLDRLSCSTARCLGSAETRCAYPGHHAGVCSCHLGTHGTAGRFGAVIKPPEFLMGTVVSGACRQWLWAPVSSHAPELPPCSQGWLQRQHRETLAGDGEAAAVPHLGIAPRVWVGPRSISVA